MTTEREKTEVRALIEQAGYAAEHAETLIAEGMGPEEVRHRLQDRGDLVRTHGFKRTQDTEAFDRRLREEARLLATYREEARQEARELTATALKALTERARSLPDPYGLVPIYEQELRLRVQGERR